MQTSNNVEISNIISKDDVVVSRVLNDLSLGVSKPLGNALIRHMGGSEIFKKLFDENKEFVIDDETYGFSGHKALDFYHENKREILNFIRHKAKAQSKFTAFDWFEGAMGNGFYDRDAVAEAIHEPMTNNPSVEHLIAATLAIQLLGNTVGDAYKRAPDKYK